MDTVRATLDDVRALMTRATGDEKHEESTTSTMDALWVLYDRILRIDPADARGARIATASSLSKGHGPAALYAILAAKGFFPGDVARRFLEHGGHLGSHPDRTQVPGIEASTGSLGHGLAMAVGIALALRAKGLTEQRVVRPVRRRRAQRGLELGGDPARAAAPARQPDPARDRQPQLDADMRRGPSGSARSAGTSTSSTATTTTRSRRAFRVRHDGRADRGRRRRPRG